MSEIDTTTPASALVGVVLVGPDLEKFEAFVLDVAAACCLEGDAPAVAADPQFRAELAAHALLSGIGAIERAVPSPQRLAAGLARAMREHENGTADEHRDARARRALAAREAAS